MDVATEKRLKNRKNMLKTENIENSKIRELFLKTEEMKEESIENNKQIKNQFDELRERLTKSSGFLNQIKKNIDNIKFSYQRDIMDLENVAYGKNRDDINQQIEEIKLNISKLQSQVKEEKRKPQNYQEAINDVLSNFQKIANGKL